jgi:carbon monoxide dehydrogenase subunit G
MEVKLEKRYPVDATPAQCWAVLRDVRAVAGCMPGASITDQVDATHFKGAVKLKVGPANAAFAGDIEVLALDETAHRVQLLGKGADKGGSTASMDLTATVEAGDTPGQAVLVGVAAVIVNGKFAQFGGRMMVQVSDMILGQFADNFRIAAAAVPVAASPATAAPASVIDTPMSPPAEARTAPAAAPPKATTELNALAIGWAIVKSWFAGLFGKRA